jgi:hypothetical protein
MNRKTLIVCSAAFAVLASVSGSALAQGRGAGQAGPSAPPVVRGDRDMDRVRDRLDTPDQDRLRDRDRDLTGDKDRLRDRDRLNTVQAETQVSALSLLTDAERLQFQQQMRAATSDAQRAQIRNQHRQTIEARARDLGVGSPFAKSGAGTAARQQMMMAQILTDQERVQFRDQMRSAATEQERQRIRNTHQELIRERAREMGMELPAGFGGGSSSRR